MKRDELIARLLEKLRGNECQFNLEYEDDAFYTITPERDFSFCELRQNELLIEWSDDSLTYLPLSSEEYDMFLTRISSRLEIKVPEGALE